MPAHCTHCTSPLEKNQVSPRCPGQPSSSTTRGLGKLRLGEIASPHGLCSGPNVGHFKRIPELCSGMLSCFGEWFIFPVCVWDHNACFLWLTPGVSVVALSCRPARQGLLLCYDSGTEGPLGSTVTQKISNNTWWRHFRCLKLNRHMEKGLTSHVAVRWVLNRVGWEVALCVGILDANPCFWMAEARKQRWRWDLRPLILYECSFVV